MGGGLVLEDSLAVLSISLTTEAALLVAIPLPTGSGQMEVECKQLSL